jgi:hypothetical protein
MTHEFRDYPLVAIMLVVVVMASFMNDKDATSIALLIDIPER